ncbi:hypothetical protein ACJX0J_009956 [Zea mays]
MDTTFYLHPFPILTIRHNAGIHHHHLVSTTSRSTPENLGGGGGGDKLLWHFLPDDGSKSIQDCTLQVEKVKVKKKLLSSFQKRDLGETHIILDDLQEKKTVGFFGIQLVEGQIMLRYHL